MVAISTAAQSWRPSWVDEAEAPTFTWRAPTVTERELFEGEMARHNALAVFPWDIATAFREGLAHLLADDPEEAERLEEIRSRQVAGEALTPVETGLLAETIAALMQYWPGYRLVVEQQARRETLLPLVAFRKFVTGWEGKVGPEDELPCTRGIDGMIKEEIVGQIDPSYMRSLGVTIYNGMYARGAEKNSAPPSPSVGDPPTSTTTTPRDGKSDLTSGA